MVRARVRARARVRVRVKPLERTVQGNKI